MNRVKRIGAVGIPIAIGVALGIALAACVPPPRSTCVPGEQVAVLDALYFGTAKAGGPVTAAEWRQFVAEVVTPRFPQGFTSWETVGQWQNEGGKIEREASYVLHVVHAPVPENDAAIREIADEYKHRFKQETVMRVHSPTCASF